MNIVFKGSICHTWADPDGGQRLDPTPGKSQVAICFLRNTGMDHLRGSDNSRGRSVWPAVEYVNKTTTASGPSLTDFLDLCMLHERCYLALSLLVATFVVC